MDPGHETPGTPPGAQTLTEDATHDRDATRDAPNGTEPASLASAPGPRGVSPPPGSLSERYEIGRLLGRGGMGAVHLARDRRLDRDVALKLLTGDGDDGGERLLREARAQARIEHENVCKVYEAGVDGGVPFIAMQYIAGEPFGRAHRDMTLEEKVGVVRTVALALHEAHRSGLVHRDVKPGNILVERRADGAPRPYIVDFGIAREAGALGPTATGALAGTPAFMAPEQVRGEIHTLDRRTDVYGLGATLFTVLAGRSPFEGQEPWTLMRRIVADDAPPLRSIAPGTPRDVEAIVARCLEKDPDRRYESARALAEDLRRFLDGEPVRARRLSPGYALYRWARRRRAILALAAALIAAALATAALRARDLRAAEEQARFAREIGEDVKEIELFLRNARGLPLHDIEREREFVRTRLREVQARMAAAGRAGEGPGRYALGRGHLALGEPERALDELGAARAAGYAPPELDYAAGMARSQLYQRALDELKRIDDPELRKAREAEAAAEHIEPALRHLRAALGARVEVPAYIEGVIALREGRPDEALERARDALASAPWLYEANILEGDAHFAKGSPFGHDAAFDHDRMMEHFRRAASAYRAAAETGRSDPRAHEMECSLWTQIMNASAARPETLRPSYATARAACERAVAADSKSASSRIALGLVEALYAWQVVLGSADEELELALADAIERADEAAALRPEDPMAPYVAGLAWSAYASYENVLGLDNTGAVRRSIDGYEDALALDPLFVWARNDLASTYLEKGRGERIRGLDATASFEEAIAHSRRAASLQPGLLHAHANQAAAHLKLAEHLLETGRDPSRALEGARAAIAVARSISPEWPWADPFAASADWIEASHALAAGRDPTAAIERGAAIAEGRSLRARDDPEPFEGIGRFAMLRAASLARRGRDAHPALAAARAAFRRASDLRPADTDYTLQRARVELLALRSAPRAGAGERALVAEVERWLRPLVERPRPDARACQAMAELREIEARRAMEAGRRAVAEVEAGLGWIERALAESPRLAAAHATKGALLVLRARGASGAERVTSARAALEAVSEALRRDPLSDAASTLREAEALLGGPAAAR